jgi:hypothetical protein
LDRCFKLTNIFIQHEIYRILNASSTNKKSAFILTLTLEELQQAQHKINNLLYVIDKRMAMLKSFIPPTMPFLGF